MKWIDFKALSLSQRQSVWAIYEDSFPTHETRTFDDHMAAVGDSRFHADAVYDGETLAGLIFYWVLDRYAYVEHFAIDASLRGQNYGTRILKAFCQAHPRVILEIEPPTDAVTKNREHFYHRLGFLTTPFSYEHPAYRSAYMPHQLVLMSYPEPIDEAMFKAFQQTMFHSIMRYSGKPNL